MVNVDPYPNTEENTKAGCFCGSLPQYSYVQLDMACYLLTDYERVEKVELFVLSIIIIDFVYMYRKLTEFTMHHAKNNIFLAFFQ